MWELSLESGISLHEIQKAMKDIYGVSEERVVSYQDYWNLDDFDGFFGLKLVDGGKSYPTFATFHEAPDRRRNLPEIATRFSSYFGCNSLVGWEEDNGHETAGRFLEFHPDKRVFEGFVADPSADGDFRIEIVRELTKDEIDRLFKVASQIAIPIS